MILVIDNYDSFVHNLARYFQNLGQVTQVVRNDRIEPAQIPELRPDAVVLSPGPSIPDLAGCSISVVRELTGQIPILGVCLGHQAIVRAFGGQIGPAETPVHGRTSEILHNNRGVFHGLENPLTVGRYHSLVAIGDVPSCLDVTATTQEGTIMAIQHRHHAVVGLQFHPESILTNEGFQILAGFLKLAGVKMPSSFPSMRRERCWEEALVTRPNAPSRPITF